MKRLINFGVGFGLFIVGTSLMAAPLEIEYKGFYSHVRKLNSDDTQGLQFSFGLAHRNQNRLCVIKTAKIVTEKKTIDLSITPEYRFTVPSERALNMARAKVVLDVDEPHQECDMSVQLETEPSLLKQYYSQSELLDIQSQYDNFFLEMGSFMSFMMPSVKGLMFHFEDRNLTRPILNDSDQWIRAGVLTLDNESLGKIKDIKLPQVPMRITALAGQ